MNASKPIIAVTMGDPAGVGPEVCLRLLNREPSAAAECVPVVFGSARLLRRVAEEIGAPFSAPVIDEAEFSSRSAGEFREPTVLDLGLPDEVSAGDITPGRVDARCGEAAWRFVLAAIDAALAGRVDAVTTAPLNKEALRAAGHRFPGQTEIFAERMGAERSCMLQVSDEVSCSFVTVHVGYGEVPELLSVERIVDVVELTDEAMRRIRGRVPKLLICGLNPHAGEHGLFGQGEEERFIVPAVAAAREKGIAIEGPVPPDTAFLPARRKATDAVVCLYHDQGHIPLKALAFDSAVNTTLGLPVVRTSVDHGTAFDIAWRGKASPNSLFAAVGLAAKLSR